MVNGPRKTTLCQGKELSVPVNNVGVTRRVIRYSYARVVGEWISVNSKQSAICLAFKKQSKIC